MTENSLTIRAYSKQRCSHWHHHHQLVLPIQGAIHIALADYQGRVAVGECVVVPSRQRHHFHADEAARFVVADMQDLPANLAPTKAMIFSVTPPLLSYLSFIETQLEYQLQPEIEKSIFQLFYTLLKQQGEYQAMDPRIRRIQAFIHEHLNIDLSINQLAERACLSPTQFKKLFKTALGLSVHQFITQQRMEKAKALLTHTDLPVQLVAERVGYKDLSAFSRRFSIHFGLSPRECTR
ncbi:MULTISPECIES: helix-turn-helix domain-containing protein [unclassified Agarivorans]|uniref:helix-turn-helix domain-containing protein n=1 Tax=unclassified Agarivorans TaxID=2636026 RepID=UPI003D7DDBA6